MIDLFSTNTLMAIVEDLRSLPPSNPTLLTMFFPTMFEETSEFIHFDTDDKPRRIAPFVHPLSESKTVEILGHATKTFTPAYVKDRRTFDANRPLRRVLGEPLLGAMTPEARIARLLAIEIADQLNMVRRRKEVMAGEALATGKVTVTGIGYPSVVVDYGRAAGQTLDISGSGTLNWATGSAKKPVEDLEAWSELILKGSGAGVSDIVFTPNAWKLLRGDSQFEKAIDIRRALGDSVPSYSSRISTGLNLVATLGTRRLWTYYDWYINDSNVEVPILADNTVILASGSLEGAQAHGAIRDEEAGFQATEFWAKSWITKDPSSRQLLGQSAPLVIPFRPNASMAVTVAP